MSLRRPQAVVFDLDGTLIDSESLVREAYMAVSRQFGVPMSDAQFLALVGLHRAANDVILRGYWGEDFPLEAFHEATRAYVGGRAAPLKPGALDLMALFAGWRTPVGLATSSRRPWVERHFTAHGIAGHFAAVVTRDDCEHGKPHPEPYLRASADLGAAPADVLALEDSFAGVRSAHAAGCMTVMIPDLLAPDAEMREKAIVAETLAQVESLLRGLA